MHEKFVKLEKFIEGTVESLALPGGVLRSGGQVWFVPGTCPGDTVRAIPVDEKKRQAKLAAVIQESPDRVHPACPLFGVCGGCSLQHIAYPRQVLEKKRMIADALMRIGGFPSLPEIEAAVSPPYGYRNRIELHTSGGRAGFKAAASDRIIPVDDCPVAVDAIRDYLKSWTADATRQTPAKRFTVYGYREKRAVEGTEAERLFIEELGVAMDARVFFQSNLMMQVQLVEAVAAEAGSGRHAADVYAGAGVFASVLARRFERVTVVEENPLAIALARENLKSAAQWPQGAQGGQRAQIEYYAFSAQQFSAHILKGRPSAPYYETIIADPPRQGLCAAFISLLITIKPQTFIYVSCNPATLARDAKQLCENGFRLEPVRFYDFYPQTAHIECMAVFK